MCLKAAAAAAANAPGDGPPLASDNVNSNNSKVESTGRVDFASPSSSSLTSHTFEKKHLSTTHTPTTSLSKMMLSACPPVRPTAPSPLLEPASFSFSPPPFTPSPGPTSYLVQVVHKPIPISVERQRRPSIGTASTSSSTNSTVSSSSTSSTTSVVRFASSPPLIHNYEMEYTEEDKPSLWYSKKDIQSLQEEEKQNVKSYVQDQDPAYVTSLLKIWSTPIQQPEVLSRLVQPIQDTPLRGLEKHSLRAMKARRGVVLKKVLQAQHDLRCWVEDPQERAVLLREECQPLSRTSARFARAMALGDYAVMTAAQLGT